MSPAPQDQGPMLENYGAYLRMLAQLHWDERLQGRMDPSDLVHDTLVEAWRNLDQYRGHTEAEFAGWLRACLVHNLLDARQKILGNQGDDRPREVALLDAAMNESSLRLNALIAADQSSPSERASRNEELRSLEDALAQLAPPQQEAVRLHHLKGMPLAEVARRLGRSEASVAGLLRRGLSKLREYLHKPG